VAVSDSELEATLEKELVRARLEVELFHKRRPVRLGRFEVLRCIGRGSLGVVYEARDTVHGGHVALKLLRRVDGRTIAQFKHEFRVLSGIAHANLVSLHELVCERDRWFVSMELIEGVPFDRWLSEGAVLDERRLADALAQLVNAVSVIHRAGKLHRDLKPSNVLVTVGGRLVVLDYGLVSAAYAQKLGGPLVAPAELGSAARGAAACDSSQWRQGLALRASPPVLIGTPGYMAPEQAAREPAQEASDWYAVGVMLFEVLARRLPFDGSTRTVLRDKQVRGAPRVRELNPSVTHALDALCRKLLERDPAKRAGAAEIEAWLGRRASRIHPAPARGPSFARESVAPAVALHGRARELQLLAAALEQAPRLGGARVWVSGAPGIGKTALLDAFAASIEPTALVLRGRCREDESIPLKVFDAIADAMREAFAGAGGVVPELTLKERVALVAAFPVLGEVEGLGPPVGVGKVGERDVGVRDVRVAEHGDTDGDSLDTANRDTVTINNIPSPATAHELAATIDAVPAEEPTSRTVPDHSLACSALSRLLAGLASRRAVVILIDDLQWADLDSALQFERVFSEVDAPGLLFVGTFRRDGEAGEGFVGAALAPLRRSLTRSESAAADTLIELEPLSPAESTQLAHTLLRAHGLPASLELCRKLASDTRGIPFLLSELVRQLKRPRRSSAFARSSTGAIALAYAIRARVEALPAGARRLLAVLCVAQAPLALKSALSVAKLPFDEHTALTLLCTTRLARSRGGRPIETLEPYHERVRESVLQALSADERTALATEIALAAAGCT
jgi:hypothetical protein